MKFPIRQITKTIDVAWNQDTRQKLISFWAARRFHFHDALDASLSATRGHILWNLISFDMSRLRADLKICPLQSDRVSIVLTINTIFQQITQWNQMFWKLEMDTCESFLLRGDLRERDWNKFLKGNRNAAIAWALTVGLGGQRVPQKSDEKQQN